MHMPLVFLTIFSLVVTLTIEVFTSFWPKIAEPTTVHQVQFKLSSLNVL